MQNENLENQASPIRRNPSRNNTNVNQGQGYDKQRFNEESEENRNSEANSAEHDRSKSDVDGGGVSDTSNNQGHQFGGGEAVLERGFSGNQQARQVPEGTPNSGSQIQKESQKQSGESMNQNSGTAEGQDSGQFNQSQEDAQRQ